VKLLFYFSDTDQTLHIYEKWCNGIANIIEPGTAHVLIDSYGNLESLYIRSINADHHIFISTRTMFFACFRFGKKYLSLLHHTVLCTFMTSSLTLFMISALSEGATLLLVVCCASWIQLTGALSREEPIFADKFQARDYSKSQNHIFPCHHLFCPSVQGFLFTGQEVCALSS
jgi:hypothetical protein